MTRCSRCHRPLRHPVMWAGLALGSTCAKAVGAAVVKQRKSKRIAVVVPERDERQFDLFAEVSHA